MRGVDDFFESILEDFYNCINVRSCEECEANKKITTEHKTTYCQFLSAHNEHILNGVEKFITNN